MYEVLWFCSRAADWNLATPDWKGRLRVVSMGEKCLVKLEDKLSGEFWVNRVLCVHLWRVYVYEMSVF